MMNEKFESTPTAVVSREVSDDTYLGIKTGTARDALDMKRMGKDQELRLSLALFGSKPHRTHENVPQRNFNFYTMFSLTALLILGWEAVLGTVAFGLLNGGTAGLIYDYIAVAILFMLVNVSMAEMASMAPTSGGQYHWVSEFAPRSLQKPVSYLIGWLCVLGWQTGVASSAFLCGSFVEGLVILNNPDYIPHRWHGTLLAIAIAVFVAIFLILCSRQLPIIEGAVLVLHIAGFFAIIATLWALAPRASSGVVWTNSLDGGDRGSVGLSCLVGMITPVVSLLGADSAAHMSEELKDAFKTLPRVMVWISVINSILGFVMLVTFIYTIADVEQVVSTSTGLPVIQVFYNTTQSLGGATAMTSILLILYTANTLTNMACASRQLFAFARDGGVPFYTWFATVKFDIPIKAILFSCLFSCFLHLISLGSTIAFNQIVSLGLGALLSSYFVSIECMAWTRIRGEPLLPSRFSLGKLGLPINLLAMAFAMIAWVFSFFPPVKNPGLETMNWSSVVYVGVLAISFGYYVLFTRHHYVGPVEYVRRSDHVQL